LTYHAKTTDITKAKAFTITSRYIDDVLSLTYHAKTTDITKAKAFTITFRYIDDVLSINDPNFAKWIPLIYLK
jgi:hypothetical protein